MKNKEKSEWTQVRPSETGDGYSQALLFSRPRTQRTQDQDCLVHASGLHAAAAASSAGFYPIYAFWQSYYSLSLQRTEERGLHRATDFHWIGERRKNKRV